jgi:hypothetical protein
MTSSYTINQGIEKPAAGDQSGTWGGTVNTNMDIIDRVVSGVGALTLTGSTTTLTTTDGTLTDGMYRVLVLGDGGDLGSNNTITISPNDQDKLYLVYNNLTANRSAIFSQGSGDNATVENGETAWIYADGAGSGAAVRVGMSSTKLLDQDGDTGIRVEEGGDDDDTIRFDVAGAEDFTITANTFTASSGSTIAAQALTATSLTGLTTPLTVAQGGSGAATHTANGVLLGAGTGAVTTAAPSTSGNVLTSNGTVWASAAAPATDLTAIADGSVGSPSLANSGDTNTGLYFPAADTVGVTTGGAEIFRVSGTGAVYVQDSANANMTNGITINQGAADDEILAFKSSDVAHGITDVAETDTFGMFKKFNAPGGGLWITGIVDSGDGNAAILHGISTNNNTAKTVNAHGGVELWASADDGTDRGTVGSNGNLAAIKNNGSAKFLFDAEGDFHADSSSTTFDSYDDAQLARTFDLSHNRGVIASKFDKFISYNHEKLANLEIVGREEDGSPNHFINVTGMQRLHNGAIWQQYEKHENLLNAVYELAVEAVGEDKANEILDKNEIKLLSSTSLLN